MAVTEQNIKQFSEQCKSIFEQIKRDVVGQEEVIEGTVIAMIAGGNVLLEGVPGVKAHRVDESTGSNMAGWYAAHGLYRPEELGGLSVTRFCEALRAEGFPAAPGCNAALHSHELFRTCDVYGDGKPTRIANSDYDVREMDKDLVNAEATGAHTYSIPWFKKYEPEVIEQYANAVKKVSANYKELLAEDPGNPAMIGGYHFFNHSKKEK